MKIRVGILFGGSSREREISFAGGRTVYDNLDKSLFEPVPLFVDSFGNFCLLKWEYIYKGSIRDFYPPQNSVPTSPNSYQIYAESLGNLSGQQQFDLLSKIGEPLTVSQLKEKIDFAFLCLHGPFGEDGKIQGMLEYFQIPYSGSGILPSSIGIDKSIQKRIMNDAGFRVPAFMVLRRHEWFAESLAAEVFEDAKRKVGFPMVIKSATQGSSIGISIIREDNLRDFINAVNGSFFTTLVRKENWILKSKTEKSEYIRNLCDIRHGIGIPVFVDDLTIYHPEELLDFIEKNIESSGTIWIRSANGESRVVIEAFIRGKEFSCIVIQDEQNKAIALPPTEILKGDEMFDYRSKYLPGLARKITPIRIAPEKIQQIREECERMFTELNFDVYARIDGFIDEDGKVFLNDPNTTSGMMPSSFFFHQAAEIGLNPSQFLTFIIRTSLARRVKDAQYNGKFEPTLKLIDQLILNSGKKKSGKIKIGVILGGYSFERHISVESGRNVYEKLASSEKYEPIPFFLSGNENKHSLFTIPINILLKDNADDIREKINNYSKDPVIESIIERCKEITVKYAGTNNLEAPREISYPILAEMVSAVFIALHGRPGEDGEVQKNLERVGLPYNGSGPASSSITIDKFTTNEILAKNGFLVAKHQIAQKELWKSDKNKFLSEIKSNFNYPLIAKPVDDGCSAAVRKIKTDEELISFADLIFRSNMELDEHNVSVLHLKTKEEFPRKDRFLIEELISKNDASHFLEITGGMLTHIDKSGIVKYELFESSEALSDGEVLSLEEKFLAGEGQNITPARFSKDPIKRNQISEYVKNEFERAAKILNIEGYARIDAFVRVFPNKTEVIFVEVNSLPGMTPATCIFHQCAISGYKPFEFIDRILEYGFNKLNSHKETVNN